MTDPFSHDANNAALAYSIDGVAATKVIKRQKF